MQKEIPKRIPEYILSIRVIEERHSPVPLTEWIGVHRMTMRIRGKCLKIADAEVLEYDVLIRAHKMA